ncbi:MAG: ABC transporter transmembrane domain-containing protein [Candidatus Gastranaerophilales bacterium]|nr:ABC transporter transmembrane domain-containing protein [Candidatus Gastranaerophilales bacterium]
MKLYKKIFKDDFIYYYKRLFLYVKPYMFRVLVATFISLPIGAMEGLMAWSIKPFTDGVLVGKNVHMAQYFTIGIIVFALVQGILNYISTYTNNWVGMKITNDIKRELFNKLLKLETAFYDKNATGYIVSRFLSDVDSASNGLIGNVRTFLQRIFTSIALIGVLIYNSWQLAIIAVIVLVSSFLPLAKLRKKLKYISEEGVKVNSHVYTNFNESCSGNRIVAAYNLQDTQEKKFMGSINNAFRLSMKSAQISGWLGPIMHIIASIGIAIVVGFGSYLITSNKLTAGSFASFVLALIALYNPMRGIGGTVIQAQNSFFAIGRILELLDYKTQIKDKHDAVEVQNVQNGIKFENVRFEYEKDKPILNNINLDVKIGETLALVGNSGGGKSTIVNLIPRFYDVLEGSIKIDDVDIRNIKLDSLRNNIAVVFQDNFLFDGTIRDNILLGNADATEEELQKAIRDSFLDEFITTLEKGLDTQIGERGVLLSGGQKQRVAIARALIKNAPIVILDEATSALDNKSEAIVQKAIDSLMQNRTVFVIAHRLSTVKNATRIAVIDDGHIVETGSHDDLVAKTDGIYKNLYYAQFKQKEKEQITVEV